MRWKRTTSKTAKPKKIYTINGVHLRNKTEADFAAHLTDLDIVWAYEAEKFRYSLPGRRYTPDFKFKLAGDWVYIEVKGYLRPEDRTKMVAVRDQHPEIDLRIVFQDASKKISKSSKMTYGEWATKHCFKWSEKTMLDQWLKEQEGD